MISARNKMAVHLNLKTLKINNEKNSTKLHWMPCTIKANSEAKVSEYFESTITKVNSDVLQASFRGRPLLGKEVNVPENYTGVVLQETNEKLSDEAERDLYEVHLFDKFTCWNWDIEPSENDKINMALEWIDVAEALHSPVNPDDEC